jgi:hypothetical protein
VLPCHRFLCFAGFCGVTLRLSDRSDLKKRQKKAANEGGLKVLGEDA